MSDVNTSELPENWAVTTVGEICTAVQYGYTASASESPSGPRFLRITDIQHGQVHWPSVPYCKIEDEDISKYELCDGDIVFARTGGTVGKSYLISSVPEQTVFASYLIRLSAHSTVDCRFLYYFFQSGSYWEQIGLKKGGLQGNVNATTLSSLELPLCALPEQKRIVAKIEQLFSELDNSIESLTTARAQLKVYRQAVLKDAFEGNLTAQWRQRNKDELETPDEVLAKLRHERETQYEQAVALWKTALDEWRKGGGDDRKPTKPRKPMDPEPIGQDELENLPTLPTYWKYARFGSFIDTIEAGKSFKCNEREPGDDEVGVAKVSAVTWGEYDEHESKTCLNPERIDEALFIRPGDFLFSRANTIELVGACVIARRASKNVMLSDKTLRIKLRDRHKRHLLQYLRCRMGRNEIMRRSTGNQESMRNIGQDRIKSIIVPACSEAEMVEIDKVLSARFTVVDALESAIESEISRSHSLRQSILKRAFSGKLVEQDPNDEPASVVLERIKAEWEEPAKNSRATRKKNKRTKTRKDAA